MDETQVRLGEALKMLDAFISVGSRRFDLTQTNLNGESLGYRPGRTEAAMRILLPVLVPLSWKLHHNLIIRPLKPARALLAQLDDLNQAKLDRVRGRAFLLLETSPANHQAWMAIEGGDEDLIRRLVKGVGVDWNASRAVRMAGSPNCKPKYAPDFPMVKIVDFNPARKVVPDQLQDLLAPEPARPSGPVRYAGVSDSRGWPDYQQCLRGAPTKLDGTPDRSEADFMWCKWALERGNPSDAVPARLREVSTKARQEWARGNEDYVRRTVAAAIKAKVWSRW